jgi:hypothetical protein
MFPPLALWLQASLSNLNLYVALEEPISSQDLGNFRAHDSV